MIEDKVPTVNPEFIMEEFENEILLYTVTDTKAVYLNETAHLIWKLCKDNLNVKEIIVFLKDSYPDQKETIRDEVISALKLLADIKAISFTDAK